MHRLITLLGLAATVAAGPAAAQVPIEALVGSGPNWANVVVQFSDGDLYRFVVLHDAPSTGLDLIETLDADLAGFEVDLVDFGFGPFVSRIAYDGNDDDQDLLGGPEDFWHYWVASPFADEWTFSPVGARERPVLLDGAWDGWRFGTADPPAPAPDPPPVDVPGLDVQGCAFLAAGFACLGMALLGHRRS